MKKLLIGLLFSICGVSHGITYQSVRASTSTALTPTIQVGTMNLSSGTIRDLNVTYGIRAATATINSLTLQSISISSVSITSGTFNTISVSSNTILNGATFYSDAPLSISSITASGYITASSATVQNLTGTSVTVGTGTATTMTVSSGTISSHLGLNGELQIGTTTGVSGQMLISQGANTAPLWTPIGRVYSIAIASTTTSSATAVTGAFIPTGSSVSITPKFSTDRVLIFATGSVDCAAGSSCVLDIQKSGTNLGDSTNGSTLLSVNGGIHATTPVSLIVTDSSPNTTATTYRVAMKGSSGSTVYGNSSTQWLIAVDVGQ